MEVSRYLHLNCVRVRSLASRSYQGQWDYVLSLGNKDYLARVKRSNRDHLRRRLQERMAKDPVVQKQWVEIEKEICDKCRM